MPYHFRLLLGIVLVGMISACASTQPSPAGARKDLTRITYEEIRGTEVSTAFDVVQRLRPHWLEVRGRDSFRSPSSIVVYVDNVRMGDPATLRQMSVTNLREIQFIDAITATRLYGTNHGAGAILVRTR